MLGPTPADDTVTPCSSQVNNVVVGNGTPPVAQVLPVMSATDSVFGVKAANQGKTSFQVGAQTTDGRNGWMISLERQDPIPQSPLKIKRGDHRVVERLAWRQGSVDRERCRVRDRVVAATHPRGSGAERADYDLEVRGDLARAEARCLRGSGSSSAGRRYSQPVAVFSQPAFWSFVGGRVVTLRWFHST